MMLLNRQKFLEPQIVLLNIELKMSEAIKRAREALDAIENDKAVGYIIDREAKRCLEETVFKYEQKVAA